MSAEAAADATAKDPEAQAEATPEAVDAEASPESRKAAELTEQGVEILRAISERPTGGQFEKLSKFADKLIAEVGESVVLMREIFGYANTREHHYTRSVHVAALALHLAKAGPGCSDGELRSVVLAALLRDLGMGRLPTEIREKTERVSDSEYEIIKRHVRYSTQMLEQLGTDDYLLRVAIAQHHERADGSGYPDGRTMADINPFAMVVALADRCGALFTNRSYRKAMDVFPGLRTMMKNERAQFGEIWVRRLVELLSR